MITMDFITALFYEVDEQLGAIPKHPEAHLWPSEDEYQYGRLDAERNPGAACMDDHDDEGEHDVERVEVQPPGEQGT